MKKAMDRFRSMQAFTALILRGGLLLAFGMVFLAFILLLHAGEFSIKTYDTYMFCKSLCGHANVTLMATAFGALFCESRLDK